MSNKKFIGIVEIPRNFPKEMRPKQSCFMAVVKVFRLPYARAKRTANRRTIVVVFPAVKTTTGVA